MFTPQSGWPLCNYSVAVNVVGAAEAAAAAAVLMALTAALALEGASSGSGFGGEMGQISRRAQ